MIIEALKAMVTKGGIVEIRAFNVPKNKNYSVKTVSGYFSSATKAQQAIEELNKTSTVYMTLNEVEPDLLARAKNKLIDNPKSTTPDKYIIRRRWLAIDCDPIRPAGIGATDAELQKALDKQGELTLFLEPFFGLPKIEAISGNGGHLLYEVDLPNTPEITQLFSDILIGLHKKFDDDYVSIDRTVFNPARIWKVYGTVSKKGDEIPTRPHRLAYIDIYREDADVVTLEQLKTLKSSFTPESGLAKYSLPTTSYYKNGKDITVDSLIETLDDKSIIYTINKKSNGETVFKLDQCLNSTDHADGSAIILSADGVPGFKCHHNTCYGVGMAGKIYQYLFKDEETNDGKSTPTYSILTGEKLNIKHSYIEGFERPKQFMDYLPLHDVNDALANNQLGDGELFAQLFDGVLIKDKSLKKDDWLAWDGHYWKTFGGMLNTFSHHVGRQYLNLRKDIRIKIHEINKKLDDDNDSDDLKKAKKKLEVKIKNINARNMNVKTQTRAIGGIKYSENQLDIDGGIFNSDPMLIGTVNGVIDLNRKMFRNGKPEDYITNILPIEFDVNATCPRWECFIHEIMGDDREMYLFLQRLFGYSMTGLQKEHIFPILWGENGRNGKGVLFNTIKAVLGELSGAGSHDLVIKKRQASSGSSTPSMMYLQGKRVVWVEEPSESMKIDSGLVKSLSGGGEISGRHLYQNQVTFTPTHTLFLVTNPKPYIYADDSALWERVILIPFVHRFIDNPDPSNPLEHLQDKDLEDKLAEELPGILNWLIAGYYSWMKQGLNPPKLVRSATDKYKDENDQLVEFLEDKIIIDHDKETDSEDWIKRSKMFAEYKKWCLQGNYDMMMKKDFFDKMDKKGYETIPTKNRIVRYKWLTSKKPNLNK